MRGDLITLGSSLVALAIIPTPDDVTVISPIIQLVAGVSLIGVGLVLKKKND